MNCEQANRISITHYLSVILGKMPKSVKGDQAHFLSPFRNEENPSFNVNISKNIWYDAGMDNDRGTMVDFICQYRSMNVKEALQHLSTFFLSNPQEINKPSDVECVFVSNKNHNTTDTFEITRIEDKITDRRLIYYACSQRKIAYKILNQYTKEIHYTAKEKPFFAIGFQNDSGGWELRNALKYGKFAIAPKTITTIKGTGNTGILNIFEGFFDFLSAFEYYGITESMNDTIVLNSTTNAKHIFEIVQNYRKINAYLDNDNAGYTARTLIQKYNSNIVDYSQKLYPKFNDFNSFLQKHK